MRSLIRISCCLFAALGARADVSLAPLFADHAVLQRDKPVPVWGRAEAGEKVAVHFGGQTRTTTTGSEVIVTQTVKDLVAGSGFRFDDRGEHDLKGVPDRWHLYAVAPTTTR